MNLRRRPCVLLLGGLVLVAAGCSTAAGSSEPDSYDDGGGQRVVAAMPMIDASAPATSAPSPATTASPTTAVSTTAAPTTAAPTTTTAAPTTTTTTPPPTTPRGAPVAALDVALPALGDANGAETERLQQRLLDLGFWLQSIDGTYGLTTRQAVMAFQKYYGLESSGEVDYTTAAFLSQATERAFATPSDQTLVEIDKGRQLLFIVHEGQTLWVLNTSTGNDQPYEEPDQNDPGEIQRGVSITPEGWFKTDRERPEGWWEGDLGQIYRPKYFKGGVAVHGSNRIPNYPASHGCVRVSVPAMDFIWDQNLIPLRTSVWVHS